MRMIMEGTDEHRVLIASTALSLHINYSSDEREELFGERSIVGIFKKYTISYILHVIRNVRRNENGELVPGDYSYKEGDAE